MPDNIHHQYPPAEDERMLGTALRGLPLVSPARSALPDVLNQLARKRPTLAARQRPRWLAWAAGVMAIGIGVFVFGQRDTQQAVNAVPVVSSKLQALMTQSAEWENALHRFEQQSVAMDAGTALASAELEDLIGLTDLQLGAVQNDSQAEHLWERRISLISRLTELRTQAAWQRAYPEQNPMLLSATYQIN